MEARRFERIPNFRLRDWVEPAHPAIIRLHDELLSLYAILRERLQGQMDQAFDRASRQIGFVVATTIPIIMEFDQNKLREVRMGADFLRDTVFEKAILPVAKEWGEAAMERKLEGTYKLYAIWHEALKLRLRTDWMEPAHFRPGGYRAPVRPEVMEPAHWRRFGDLSAVRPEVMEPAHWFDPRLDIAVEDKILISVIDEIYPDVHLVDRIGGIRERVRDIVAVPPEVQEPAHFRPRLRLEEIQSLLEQIQDMIKGMG